MILCKTKNFYFLLVLTILVTSCIPSFNRPETLSSPAQRISQATTQPTATKTTPTRTPIASTTIISHPTNTLFPKYTPTLDTRLTPKHWREWNTVPELSNFSNDILRLAITEFNHDPQAFSKVGDCQFTPDIFLGGYVKGIHPKPSELEPTVIFFKESILQDSATAQNGLGISSVLNPLFGLSAGHADCTSNETPLDCELRIRKPSVVLIAMGTNWIPNAELSFERYLKQVVERVLETGALPILSTKADNIEGDWRLNYVIAKVAYEYDIPMVNVWRAVQFLPNHGLEGPENIYLTGNGWLARNEAWLRTLDVIRLTIENESSK